MKSAVQNWYENVLIKGGAVSEFGYDVLLLPPDCVWLQRHLQHTPAAQTQTAAIDTHALALLLHHCSNTLRATNKQQASESGATNTETESASCFETNTKKLHALQTLCTVFYSIGRLRQRPLSRSAFEEMETYVMLTPTEAEPRPESPLDFFQALLQRVFQLLEHSYTDQPPEKLEGTSSPALVSAALKLLGIFATSSSNVHNNLLMELLNTSSCFLILLRLLQRLQRRHVLDSCNGVLLSHAFYLLLILLHYQRYDHENPNCQHLAKGNSAMLWLWSECTEHLLLTISPLYHGTVRFESDESFTSIFFQFFRTFDRARSPSASDSVVSVEVEHDYKWSSSCLALLSYYQLLYLNSRTAVVLGGIHKLNDAVVVKRIPCSLSRFLSLCSSVVVDWTSAPSEASKGVLARLSLLTLQCLTSDAASNVLLHNTSASRKDVSVQFSCAASLATSSSRTVRRLASNQPLAVVVLYVVSDAISPQLSNLDHIGTSNLVVALDIALQLLSFEIESVDAFSIAGLDLAYVALSHSLFDLLESFSHLPLEDIEGDEVLFNSLSCAVRLLSLLVSRTEQIFADIQPQSSFLFYIALKSNAFSTLYSSLKESSDTASTGLANLFFPVQGVSKHFFSGLKQGPTPIEQLNKKQRVSRVQRCKLDVMFPKRSDVGSIGRRYVEEQAFFNHIVTLLVRKYTRLHFDATVQPRKQQRA